MLDNLLTEDLLVLKYEKCIDWFEYGSQNHIESLIGLDITKKHMFGIKDNVEFKNNLEEVNNYYNSFKRRLGILEMPSQLRANVYDEVPAV